LKGRSTTANVCIATVPSGCFSARIMTGDAPGLAVPSPMDVNLSDRELVFVVFRTNATGGAYGAAGVWVAAPESMTNVTASAPDFSAAAALFVTAGEVESGKGEPFMVAYKGVPYPVASPENYEVRFFENGSNDEVYIALPNGHFAKFTKSSSAPSDYSTLAYPVASFLADRRETYFGERAVNLDSDGDCGSR